MTSPRLYIFAGGGTGGHIYPGLAIAEHLAPPAECLFVCSDRVIDRSILTAEKARFEPAPAKPLAMSPRGLLRFLANWAPSIRLGRRLIAEGRAKFGKDGVRVVAMGGFVAAPIVQAARAERCPVMLVNLDAAPGKANRWIAGRADRSLSTFPVAQRFARSWTVIPPIVRSAATATCIQAEARSQLGLDPELPVLMITGGSQGAGSINDLLAGLAKREPSPLQGWQVVHQTGVEDNAGLVAAYEKAGIRAVVMRFVRGIGMWWRAAELAICRAGAGNVAEAWANGVPTLFLPYPWHRDQHQRLNAQVLVENGLAIVETDRIAAANNLETVGPVLAGLLQNRANIARMGECGKRLGPADGAAKTAEALTCF